MKRLRSPSLTVRVILLAVALLLVSAAVSVALPFPKVSIAVEEGREPGQIATSLQIVLLLTVLSLAPSFVVMFTCFTRIIVVFSFVRHALSTQQMPPNQILIALALFLTVAIMMPVWSQINDQALQPLLNGDIDQMQALKTASVPLRTFMLKQTREKDMALFYNVTDKPRPSNVSEVPFQIVVPAFILSELRTAFQMGFIIYVPFLVIDMVVASVLMSMGMLMLPPVMVSLPFKILLFVLVDGWNLVVQSIVRSFM